MNIIKKIKQIIVEWLDAETLKVFYDDGSSFYFFKKINQ